jgi:hypothetical protein
MLDDSHARVSSSAGSYLSCIIISNAHRVDAARLKEVAASVDVAWRCMGFSASLHDGLQQLKGGDPMSSGIAELMHQPKRISRTQGQPPRSA